MIPEIDSQIGLLVYSTPFKGSGGRIRTTEEDFLVSEILDSRILSKVVSDDGYPLYMLKKKNVDTTHALDDLFQKTGLRLKSLGLKDSFAMTEQFVCANFRSKGMESFSSQRYSIERVGYLKKQLAKKDMVGNYFKIKISQHDSTISQFGDYEKVLNFYGYQRFGSKRAVTHLIGKAIIQKDFAQAVDLILGFTSRYDSEKNTAIRESLKDKSNYSKMISILPKQMDIERKVLNEMISSDNPQSAIRAVPLTLRRFYISAYQAYLFNLTLSEAFESGEPMLAPQEGDVCYDHEAKLGKFEKGSEQNLAIPIVGFSYFKKTRFDYYISKILESEEISPKDFFLKDMQELSNEGGFRHATIQCHDYSCNGDWVEFSLSRGSFATIILREIIKPSDPISAGF